MAYDTFCDEVLKLLYDEEIGMHASETTQFDFSSVMVHEIQLYGKTFADYQLGWINPNMWSHE